ncbi:zinc finger bed domain-containing protein 1-like [Gigaspora margarita]|uniref:Zinc finger bed domain-containing protein 1-like n=1 Tax=Gigaspora margarita TaxID=4874 RepID=A0A8H4ACN5_GIGMA|nr:zinc finger bed domain-containing protein 1-like [Gigaspora margarita]
MEYAKDDGVSNEPSAVNENDPSLTSEENDPLLTSEENDPLLTSEENDPLLTSEEGSNITTQSTNKGGRPLATIWDEYDIINNGLGKHKGASCRYCPTSWARGRAQDMQSHLAMKCKGNIPREIRIKVLRYMQSEDNPMPSGSTTLKKRKSNPLLSLDAYYDTIEAIDKSKEARANKSLIKWIVSSASSILDTEAANIILKIEKELSKAKNLTLCIDSWCSPLKHSIYAFVIVTNERKQYVYAL